MKWIPLLIVLTGLIYDGYALDFELQTLERERVRYHDLKGVVTVVDFWALYCRPCVRSIPELVKLQALFEAHDVKMIGINVDGPRSQSKIRPFVHIMGINYPVLLNPNREVMELLNVNGLPGLVILNDRDEIVFRHEGFRPGDEFELRKTLEKLIGQGHE